MYQLYIYTLTNRTTRHRWGQWCHQMGPACCTIQLFRYVQKNNPQPLTSTTEEPYLESFSVTVGMCYRCYFLLSKQPSSLEEVLCTWELRPCCSHEQLQGTSQQEESDSLSNNTHQQIRGASAQCFWVIHLYLQIPNVLPTANWPSRSNYAVRPFKRPADLKILF